MAKEKSAKEGFITKGGVYHPVEGMANDITGTPPEIGPYGPHKQPGEQPFPDNPGGVRGPFGGTLIRKQLRGKKASA